MRCTDLASRSCRDRPASVCADRPALVLGRRGDVRTRPVKRTPARHGGSRRMGSRGVGRRCPRDELIPSPVLVHCSRDPTPPQKAIRAPNPTAARPPWNSNFRYKEYNRFTPDGPRRSQTETAVCRGKSDESFPNVMGTVVSACHTLRMFFAGWTAETDDTVFVHRVIHSSFGAADPECATSAAGMVTTVVSDRGWDLVGSVGCVRRTGRSGTCRLRGGVRGGGVRQCGGA